MFSEIHALEEYEVEDNKFCSLHSSEIYPFNFLEKPQNVLTFCRQMGGDIFVIDSSEVLEQALSSYTRMKNYYQNLTYIFTGICIRSDGQLENIANGNIIAPDAFETINYDASEIYGDRCIYYNDAQKYYFAYPVIHGPTICDMPSEPPQFFLRGVCRTQMVDTYFIFRNHKLFLGYIYSKIIYSDRDSAWQIVSTLTNETVAFTNSTKVKPPLGHRRWYFQNKHTCVDTPKVKYRTLSFHLDVMEPGNFCCSDGTCITSEYVCDGSPDCLHEEDEEGCRDVLTPHFYDSNDPPIITSRNKTRKIKSTGKIKVEVHIFDVLKVDVSNSEFEVFYEINFLWHDPAVSYEYLRPHEGSNQIYNFSKIWTPNLKFFHIKSEDIMEKNLIILKNDSHGPNLSADTNTLNVREIYPGSQHVLRMSMKIRQIALCSFNNIVNYPFGFDYCSIHFYLQGVANKKMLFQPYTITDSGQSIVDQYIISNWLFDRSRISSLSDSSNARNTKTMEMTLVLGRNFRNVFMVTYLPTVLMNIINQVTNYIDHESKVKSSI